MLAVRAIARRVVLALVSSAPGLVPRLAGWRILRLATLMADRFDAPGFSGLPLTLLIAGAFATLVLFGGLVEVVRSHHGDIRLDQSIDDFFKPYRSAWLLKAALWVTAIGAGPSLTAILLTATALLWSSGRHRRVVSLWTTFLGAQATTWSSKYLIARPRPVFLPNITEWNPSFPSGHATATTALVGMLGYIVAANLPTARARFEVAFWTAAIVGLICFSRLFLGVHFFTDVVAGILVGAFWLLVGYTVGALSPRRGTGS